MEIWDWYQFMAGQRLQALLSLSAIEPLENRCNFFVPNHPGQIGTKNHHGQIGFGKRLDHVRFKK